MQNKLKELAALKTEQENLQIISLVHSLDIPPSDPKAFLQPTPVPSTTTIATNYYDTQEDSEDEE